ncbi:MAG: tripartite tricarboxylate transporter TctB family protein [Alphaproteobacteria bacterium]|nr:tripartite tricarboxylate transporter TctB family protein [Alphaproteobacteria bacterium]
MREGSAGAIAVAVGVVTVGIVVGWQTTLIPMTPAYAKVGPKVFPTMVSASLILLGLTLLWQAWAGRWRAEAEGEASPTDWRALGWLGFGLVFNVALIGLLGFILASTVLFASVARAFGSRKTARDLAIAFVFAMVCYLGFARVLGINMGAGLLESFL